MMREAHTGLINASREWSHCYSLNLPLVAVVQLLAETTPVLHV